MAGNVTIVSIADVKGRRGGIGREGLLFAKPLPLDPGPGAPGMEFDWVSYGADYGTPRHRHTFHQFRYVLQGRRDIQGGVLEEGDCAYYPEGVHYGPQAQTASMIGIGLQLEGDSGIPYLRRNLGLVFQDQKLLFDRSVLDNYAYMMLACGRQPPIERFMHHWMKGYDLLFKVPFGGDLAADAVQAGGAEAGVELDGAVGLGERGVENSRVDRQVVLPALVQLPSRVTRQADRHLRQLEPPGDVTGQGVDGACRLGGEQDVACQVEEPRDLVPASDGFVRLDR